MNSKCRKCGVELAATAAADGLCPACGLEFGLHGFASESTSSADDPTHIGASLASPSSPELKLGAVGDYELLEEIARGGMGIVYKARQKSLNRIVALKMILAGQFASREQLMRFRAEAEAAGQLRHPHIVAIYETGEHQGQPYFSMDFVAGSNLAEQVKNGPLPARRAAVYARKIAEAIHYAHDQGILHRDLKPSNILIDQEDEPRVTDFGLAKRMQRDSFVTVTGQVLGSPGFMPPEQARGNRRKVGRQSDVYGLGGVLYFLLTARAPFQAESVESVVIQVLNNEPVSLRLLNPAVPRDLETICLKCLEKEPGRRYQTAQQLADELERYLKDEPIQARPISRIEHGWRWCRRKPALASAVGVAALALLVLSIGSPMIALHFKNTRELTALNLYAADIKGADVALEGRDVTGARRLLDQIAASPDQRDLRGWEWRYLKGQCRGDDIAVLKGHDSWVEAVAFSTDDQLLASISGDGVVKLWDWKGRKEVLSWQAHARVAKHRPSVKDHDLVFLPDKSTLATSGADGFVRLWRVGSTNILASFGEPDLQLGAVACSQDGRLLACGSITKWERGISLWDISQREPEQITRWAMPNSWVGKMAFSPDGRRLVVGGRTTIRRWDVSNPREPQELPQLNGRRYFGLSQDGRYLFSEGLDPECFTRFDLVSGEGTPLKQTMGAGAWSLCASPDGRSLVSTPHNGKIVFWDLTADLPPVTLAGHEDFIWGFAFTGDGKILASASTDQTIRLWDAAAVWREDRRGPPKVQYGIVANAISFSPDSEYLVSLHWENEDERSKTNQTTIKLWDVATRAAVATARQPGTARGGGHRIAFSPDGKFIAADDGGTLRLYCAPTLLPWANWTGGGPAFSSDSNWVFYVTDRLILRRHLTTGEELQVGEHIDYPGFISVAPDGATLVESRDDGTMTFWDVLRKRPPVIIEGHQWQAWGQAFSPDGHTYASVGWDLRLILWDVKERRKIAVLRGHDSPLWAVAFSPDGRTLATSGYDKTVQLWNLETKRPVLVLRGHSVNANAVAFSPDGQWLASGDSAGAVRFWRAPTFEELEELASSP